MIGFVDFHKSATACCTFVKRNLIIKKTGNIQPFAFQKNYQIINYPIISYQLSNYPTFNCLIINYPIINYQLSIIQLSIIQLSIINYPIINYQLKPPLSLRKLKCFLPGYVSLLPSMCSEYQKK